MAQPHASIDGYIATFPPEVQAVLQQLRQTIAAAAPDATQTISYGIPTFKQAGTYVMYFAGWKKHVSVYPILNVPADLEPTVALYRKSKGTLQFPLGKPLPLDLIGRLVGARITELTAKG